MLHFTNPLPWLTAWYDTWSLSPRICGANILRTSSFQCIFISKPAVWRTQRCHHLIRPLKPFSKSILQYKFDTERKKNWQFRNELISNCNPDHLCGKKRICIENRKKKSKNIMQPQIKFPVTWCSSKCKIFDFVAYSFFSAQKLRNFCHTF